MSNSRTETHLIDEFKDSFRRATGKSVKVLVCSNIESEANFTSDKVDARKVAKMILDAHGWDFGETFTRSRKGGKGELVSRRALIYTIAAANGASLSECAKISTPPLDHTSVINSLNKYSWHLQNDYTLKRFFRETMEFIKLNYPLYKNKTYTESDLLNNT